MYLGKKEVKKLKKQKRLEEILEHESSDIVNDTKEYLDEFELDIPLTRRERKLIAKQREYELLLEQIGEEKKQNAIADNVEKDKENSYTESNTYGQQEQIEDISEDAEDTDEFLNETESENVKLTRKEKRALKKEQRLMKKFEELGIDEEDLNDIDDEPTSEETVTYEPVQDEVADENLSDDIDYEAEQEDVDVFDNQEEQEFDDELGELKATWAKRKQEKKQEKQQRMQAMLDSLEQGQISDSEHEVEEDIEEISDHNTKRGFFGFGRNKRVSKKQKMQQQMEGFFAELEEKEFGENSDVTEEHADVDSIEEEFANENDSFDEIIEQEKNESVFDSGKTEKPKEKKAKRVNKEIADALNENEGEHYSNKEYLLEKVKLEIEKEKLALEKYRIKNEAKLKRQIERDKRREMMRMRKEQVSESSKDNIAQELPVNSGSNFADAIGGVIKEISKEKPEVKDLVTSSGIVTTPKSDLNAKKKKRHKRGVLVVKRSGSSYGE